MGMSGVYGPADDAESIATIRAALDAGITLLDTGDFYGMGHNELLLRQALAGRRREQVLLSVKFGSLRDPDGGWGGVDGRPPPSRTSWPIHCAGLAPIMSTYTARRASIRLCRSKRPWARLPIWCRPGMYAILAFQRPASRHCDAHMLCTPSPTCKSSTP